MKYLALGIPGFGNIQTPEGIPSGVNAPSNAIQAFLNLFIFAGVIAALLFTLYGGVLWVTSAGDKTKVDRARRTITFSIVGLIIIILAWAIVGAIGFFLGSPAALQGFQPKAP